MDIRILLELIEPEVRTFNTNRKFVDAALRKRRKDPSYVGSGFHSDVRKARDPHMVQKPLHMPNTKPLGSKTSIGNLLIMS